METNETQNMIYVEFKEGEQPKAEAMFSVDKEWKPRPFITAGVFVFRGKASEAQISQLKEAGFKVHVDKAVTTG